MTLRFLADESCDFGIVRALRAGGHDVLAIGERTSRSDDTELLRLAHSENRILLTEDKDFGWLVFASQEKSAGVILIRFPGDARKTLVKSVLNVVNEHANELGQSFAVIEPGSLRLTQR